MGKKNKFLAIQGTNDNSTVSKCSMVNAGYFQDNFIKYFVSKQQRRSPLINRGYYIRAKAINMLFANFFEEVTKQFGQNANCQIISLGAGFDSSFFRLKSDSSLPKNCKYFEIDFPEVLKRKLECINVHFELGNIVGENKEINEGSQVVFSSTQYSMLGVDLAKLSELEKVLEDAGIDFTIPTLAFSECAVVYMDTERSDELIRWFGAKFSEIVISTYEQVWPDDGFGSVMQQHFKLIGSPLKSLVKYPTVYSQEQRHLNLGWENFAACGMNDFFTSIAQNELQFIRKLEMFDEYEEWHLKCSHYMLSCSSQGILRSLVSAVGSLNIETACSDLPKRKAFKWREKPGNPLLYRFAHETVYLSNGLLMTYGGFGQKDGKHQRYGEPVICTIAGEIIKCSLLSGQHLVDSRMHHCMKSLNSGKVIISGGRKSPLNALDSLLVLNPVQNSNKQNYSSLHLSLNSSQSALESECHSKDLNLEQSEISYECYELKVSGKKPNPRWRHTIDVLTINDMDYIVLFGGCSIDAPALNDVWIFDMKECAWIEIPEQQETPCARHSHSSCVWELENVIISGGNCSMEKSLNTIYELKLGSKEWHALPVIGLLPRYSHSCHIWKSMLVLIGGVNHLPLLNPGIALIDLTTLQAEEFQFNQSLNFPILLHNHSSVYIEETETIVIIGGGGNCFSFGTHLNSHLLYISMADFNILFKSMKLK